MENVSINILLNIIKDYGLPTLALIYLFKAYIARVDRTDKVLDEYALVIKAHTKSCGNLGDRLEKIAKSMENDIDVRNKILNRLVDIFVEQEKNGKSNGHTFAEVILKKDVKKPRGRPKSINGKTYKT